MTLFFRDLFDFFATLPPPVGARPTALPLAVYREAGRVSRPSAADSRPFIHFFTKDRSERVSRDGGSSRFRTGIPGYDCSNKQLHVVATPRRRACDGMRMPPKRHAGAAHRRMMLEGRTRTIHATMLNNKHPRRNCIPAEHVRSVSSR